MFNGSQPWSGLKIPWAEKPVPVRPRAPAPHAGSALVAESDQGRMIRDLHQKDSYQLPEVAESPRAR